MYLSIFKRFSAHNLEQCSLKKKKKTLCLLLFFQKNISSTYILLYLFTLDISCGFMLWQNNVVSNKWKGIWVETSVSFISISNLSWIVSHQLKQNCLKLIYHLKCRQMLFIILWHLGFSTELVFIFLAWLNIM